MKRRLVLRDTNSRDSALAFIASLPVSAEMPLEVIVATCRKRRSLAQNNCLHGWMQAIANAYEESHGDRIPPAAWKEYFKGLFLGEQSTEVMGKIVTTTRSTSDLSVSEFQALLEGIERWAGEHLLIALPHGPEYDEAMGS